MCGIYGIINFDGKIDNIDLDIYNKSARKKLNHRGPDDFGHIKDSNLRTNFFATFSLSF